MESYIDPSHNYLRPSGHQLTPLFAPRSVAVVGASESPLSVGRTLLKNLIGNPFGGTVYPINHKRKSVLGIRAYSSISELPETVDLAVIATPAPTVPEIIEECILTGVRGAIIISAGFKELGPEGAKLEAQIRQRAGSGKIRIIGPNCLGLMNPLTGLNATFAGTMARPGNVAFISQSGALCTAILDWSIQEQVGFSAFISIGSMLDVSWGDLIDYLGDDPRTHSIVLYMESIGDARSFLSAAREVAINKPIIVIKAGRTEAAARAAASHTGALTGSDAVLDAAFRRCGVLRVHHIEDLFNMAEVLAKQPRPHGPRLTILTNAGGPGVLATDALIANGGQLAELSEETTQALNEFLPPHWSRQNPIDILGDAGPDRYSKALDILAKDPNNDGLLVILTPQDMTEPTQIAEQLRQYANPDGKPLLASWMGGTHIMAGESILNQAGIPTFPYPDTAAKVFGDMWRYSKNLRALYETPTLAEVNVDLQKRREQAHQLLEDVRHSGRTLLTEFESKQLLSLYGIPTVPTHIADSEKSAVTHANTLGYPVVLKLHSETITHKTDVGGVQLNLKDDLAVKNAFTRIKNAVTQKKGAEHFLGVTVQPMIQLDGYELIIGSSLDAQFGPVLLFGAGGQLVEIFRDSALALPPLTTTLARRLMEQTRIYHALQGIRGRAPVNQEELEKLMVRFSQLVIEHPVIKEIDINPLLASAEQLLALDARVVLHEPSADKNHLPLPAIRPYPVQYSSTWQMNDETKLVIRPIRPEDEPGLVRFHQTLSEQSVYQRYFQLLQLNQRIAHERLTRLCFIDYDREIALIVEHFDKQGAEILGVGRLSRLSGTRDAEFALIISDRFQRHGIGSELLRRLIEVGKQENLDRIVGDILPNNHGMQHICKQLGFHLSRPIENQDQIRAVFEF